MYLKASSYTLIKREICKLFDVSLCFFCFTSIGSSFFKNQKLAAEDAVVAEGATGEARVEVAVEDAVVAAKGVVTS